MRFKGFSKYLTFTYWRMRWAFLVGGSPQLDIQEVFKIEVPDTETYNFTVFYSKNDKGYIFASGQFKGLSAFGDTPEEALREGAGAFELFMDEMKVSESLNVFST